MPTKQRLLIVDDCREDCEAYQRFLADTSDEGNRYSIDVASTAEAALEQLHKAEYDLILLDYKLPQMSGLELLTEIEAVMPGFNTPIIFMTAYGSESVVVSALKGGAREYLVKKNLTATLLQKSIRQTIENHQLEQKLSKLQEQQQLISQTALQIRKTLDLETVLATAIDELKTLFGCDRVLVCQFLVHERCSIVADSSEPRGCEGQTPLFHWPQRSQWIPPNLETVMSLDLSQGHFLGLKTGSAILAPIPTIYTDEVEYPHGDSVWGVIAVHQPVQQQAWHLEDYTLLQELGLQLAIAIHQAELLSHTQRAIEAEKELNQFISKTISTVAQEFRGPLAGILSATQTVLLHDDKLATPQKDRCLNIIEQKSRFLNQLIDDLLIAEKLDWDNIRLQPQALDLVQFIEDVIDTCRLQYSHSHSITLHSQPSELWFKGDRFTLQQAFMNVLDNALKYSPMGGAVEAAVQVIHDLTIQVQITDMGIGIPIDEQDRLFNQFSRASNVGLIDGSGLGLAIAKSCVELHYGTITIDSALQEGTTVTLQFPITGLGNIEELDTVRPHTEVA